MGRRREKLPDEPMPGRGAALAFRPLAPLGPRYHLHWPGIAYILTTMLLALGAINAQNNLLFWAFGLGVGGLLVSGVVSGIMLLAVRIDRALVPPVAVGGEVRIRYRIHNRSHLIPLFGLVVDELTGEEHGLGKRKPSSWPMYLESRESVPRAVAVHVPPRGMVEVEAVARATRRGEASFDALRVWTTFPFGLARKSVLFGLPQNVVQRLVVRPLPAPVGRDELDRMAGEPQRGSVARAVAGAPDEFHTLREFSEGDSQRHVSWRASARTDTLLVRQFSAVASSRVWVELDLAGQTRDEAEGAIRRAAGLLLAASGKGAAVGLLVPRSGLVAHPRTGRAHLESLMDDLGKIDLLAPPVSAENPPRVPARDLVVRVGPKVGDPVPALAGITTAPTKPRTRKARLRRTGRSVLAWFGFGPAGGGGPA
jgi:uncharacterized protein (DUF58 family)